MSSTAPCYRCKQQIYILDLRILACHKCQKQDIYCKECAPIMKYHNNSKQETVYECYTCLTMPPKKLSLKEIRQSRIQKEEEDERKTRWPDNYIPATDHMDRDDTLPVPHPTPCYQELENGVNNVIRGITSLNDNMEHVFVTLQAMDEDLVKHVTNDYNRFTVEHELMNIKQALSRVHAVYAGLIEIKDAVVTISSSSSPIQQE